MNLQQQLQYLANAMGWAVRTQYDGTAHVEVPTLQGRTQVIHVVPGYDAEREPIVFIWSPACDWQATRDVWALLRYATSLSYGSIALQDTHVIVKHSLRLANADEVTLRKAIYYVGLAADQLEAEAYGGMDRL